MEKTWSMQVFLGFALYFQLLPVNEGGSCLLEI